MANNSIFDSAKKKCNVSPDDNCFDDQILSFVNGYLATLNQIGVGVPGFCVEGSEETWEDFITDKPEIIPMARIYLNNKTQLQFDPPASATVAKALDDAAEEMFQRCSYAVDPPNTFE